MKETKLLTSEYKDEFDKLAPHPIQSWIWGDFKESMGAAAERIGFFEDGKLKSGIQIIFSKIPKTNYTVGIASKTVMPDFECLEALKKAGKKHNAVFIKIEPDIFKPVSETESSTETSLLPGNFFEEKINFLLKNGAKIGKPFFEKYNFLLNIEKTEDELLASFHSKTRYNIRLAEKKGVSVIDKSTEEGMEDYIRLMEETTKRQGFFNHNGKYFRQMFKIFPKESLRIFEAVYGEEVLTAWILFKFNGKLYYPYGASGNSHRELMPNNLIMWEAIKYGKNLNCSLFDLWGCLGPNPDTENSWYGFHKFKAGYKPQLVEYIGTFDLVYKPFMYKLFNIADKIRWIILKNKRR
ncbi:MULTISPECIES: peptidoglycan bridge formation glycyltransferase FemA/FemB family protein [unclassified Treponema]|uniref:lipid II:glycine glycyltransferase FemX n=1 Tax=unclassified Treponema TaxID=2638727 RepID=UPI0020A432F4|nr:MULTISPECIES: peptidoglycan bridge formation glycyltransferase FemA/FemB family protein [unclassified Treponema]UTC67932.1 peptidoglycan bridge formation glycyltransferase FemA/FemB family protein [Treponema sp. OMZ 789]UTC70653.1 peptidoglycan bridge formation glycyltransferase FemA/FemB family protein [Treponema sp. OMZ 790]UTC73377.1 peptidoglycan bridge formation glycyltransferase FemA/FemB family protein [Treponema sp. OMZ 791]